MNIFSVSVSIIAITTFILILYFCANKKTKKINNYDFFKIEHPDIASSLNPLVYKPFVDVFYAQTHYEFIEKFNNACIIADKSDEESRFMFYLNVLLYCNLDAGNWLVFCSKAQEENNFFWDKLVIYSKTNKFESLSKDQKKQLRFYVDMYESDHSYYDVN